MTSLFDTVEYGNGPSACSPRFANGEPHGIKLAVPETFKLSTFNARGEPAPLPLCLSARFDGLYLSRFEFMWRSIKIVMVDDEHHEVLTTGIWRDRHYIPNPPTTLTKKELAESIFTKFSTVNLREFARFPLRKATYKVYAVLEEYKSNVATLHIDVE